MLPNRVGSTHTTLRRIAMPAATDPVAAPAQAAANRVTLAAFRPVR
jgi:hypothetical protein